MEKEKKITLSAKELLTLSTSITLCLAEKLSLADLCTLRMFFNSLASNISLIEFQSKNCKSEK